MHGGVMMHKLNIEQNVDVSFLSPISEEKTHKYKITFPKNRKRCIKETELIDAQMI